MSLGPFSRNGGVVAVVSVGSASERKHGARRSPERVSRRTRHPESASRRDTTIERRMRARATRAFDAARVARIVASPRRKLSWAEGTGGRAPSSGRRPRRAVSPARAYDSESAARPGRAATATLERARDERKTDVRRAAGAWTQHEARRGATRALASARAEARAPKRAREERDVKVMPRRARRTCGVVGERAYALLRARKCRGARGGGPSGIDTRFVGTKKNAVLCVVPELTKTGDLRISSRSLRHV